MGSYGVLTGADLKNVYSSTYYQGLHKFLIRVRFEPLGPGASLKYTFFSKVSFSFNFCLSCEVRNMLYYESFDWLDGST